MDLKNKILIAILFLFIALFAISLFKNISYPLLWNDEAETAMFAKRILEYGYPKVHDGKNIIYLVGLPLEFGIKEKSDAYIGTVWGHFYFSCLGAFLAEKAEDIYLKTALLRIPFALIGFIGMVIMVLSVIRIFKDNLSAKLLFLISFAFFELLSISLILHLREVRYYSMVLFLSGCIFYTFLSYKIYKRINSLTYVLVMALLLLLIFNTFPPAYLVFIITIGLYECLDFLKTRRVKDSILGALPLFISLIPTILLSAFFKTFLIPEEYVKMYNIAFSTQCRHIIKTLNFFIKHEFLYLIFAVKIILAFLYFYLRGYKTDEEIEQKLRISSIFTLFFIFYLLVITKLPLPFFFQRYFIILQPILIIILLLDISAISGLISNINPLPLKRRIAAVSLILISALFIFNGSNKIEEIKNHVYEIFHQYQGPLDFAIPYIRSRYQNTEDLVIATNYEECSYMYYLGSRVIIGYVGNNLKEDLRTQPDIIILRKKWISSILDWPQIFNDFLKKDRYKKVVFPVFDYPVNNIPEIGGLLPHLYRTRMAKNLDNRLAIYIKE